MRGAAVFLIWLGCTTPAPSPETGESLVVDVTPPRTDASSAQSPNRNKDAAFERCKAQIVKATAQTTATEANKIATVCSELYSDAACRDAWVKGFAEETDRTERVSIVMEGCRLGYCDDFRDAPACSDAWKDWGLHERAGAWASLREQILTMEIGAARVHELAELSGRTTAHEHGAAGAGTVSMAVDASGAMVFDGVKIAESALLDELRARLASDPSATLEVFVDPNTPIELTRKIMDAARAAGFTRVSIQAKH